MLAALLASVGGCATWELPDEKTQLPVPALPADSVRLEIEFVRVPPEWVPGLADVWAAVDEQHFVPETRRLYVDNGLRCGIVGGQLPTRLRALLDAEKPTLEQIADGVDPEESHMFASTRELRCRSGKTYKIVAAPRIREEAVVLISEGSHVRAERYPQAQGLLSLRAFPTGDSRVKLELTPFIEYGEMRQKIVPGQGSFLLDAGRDSEEITLLQIEAVVGPGETLLLGPQEPARGLGGWYFGGTHGASTPSLMLVRVAQTQFDELFNDAPDNRPLATPLDD